MLLESVRCEVLNVTYEPLQPINAKRAIRLVLEGKAQLLEAHPTYCIRSADDIFSVPTQILLKKMVKSFNIHVPAALSRTNLLIRDDYTCQYCGRHISELNTHAERGPVESMTRDHIFPQDKGGKDDWMNVTTACNRCNNKKGNTLLEKSGMTLRKQPTIPTRAMLSMKARFHKRHKKLIT